MTNNSELPTNMSPQRVDVKARHRRKITNVWWLPILALIISLFLAYQHFSALGPVIKITFPDAEGLEAGKTKLRYKNVEIGKVINLDVSEDFSYVTVTVRAKKSSAELFNTDSRFWIVKPRLSLTEITGLNTIVSGTYITVDPGANSNPPRFTFTGLEQPPIISSENDGLRITLLSKRSQAVKEGSEIYYKGLPVGQVESKEFTNDYIWVKINLVINKPFHTLINNNSRFFVTSGIIFQPSVSGVKFEFESLKALFGGGIAFYTPPDEIGETKAVPDNTEFMLFTSLQEAQNEVLGDKKRYVVYFDGSIKGLGEGTAVEFKGLKVGEVVSVRMIYDPVTNLPLIPVIIDLYEQKLVIKDSAGDRVEDTIKKLLNNGMKVSLETGNLLIGSKVITLNLPTNIPKKTETWKVDNLTGLPMLPTGSEGGFGEITDKVSSFIDKLNQFPIEKIGNNVDGLVGDIRTTLNSGEVSSTIKSLDGLLKDLRTVINKSEIDKTLGHVTDLLVEGKILSKRTQKSITLMEKTVSNLSSGLQATLSGFNPDSPLYYNLNNTILELDNTLKSIKRITKTLERQPNALIFGEELEE